MIATEPATLKSEVDKRHTPEVIENEIRAFEDKVQQVLRGEMTDDQFRRHRLTHGTYGQRQPGFQMQRIKIPWVFWTLTSFVRSAIFPTNTPMASVTSPPARMFNSTSSN